MTSDADRELLLRLARGAIDAHVRPRDESGAQPAARDPHSAILARPAGAFVTLHKRGDLRGCIGHVESNEPLGAVIPRCALAACSTDPRFPAVTRDELAEIHIEISLLGVSQPIAGPQDVVVGRDGLVVESGWHRGLLLPQVAIEWRWDAVTFLARTCEKAGLPHDAWTIGAKIWRFEAEVFGER